MILAAYLPGERPLKKPHAVLMGMLPRASRMFQQIHSSGGSLNVQSGFPKDMGIVVEMPTDYWSR